jgi:hypothetical protein
LRAPARADNPPSTPGYTLTLPATVGIGENFTTCLDAPGGSVALILVSGSPGPTPTKFGTLNVGFPFLTIWVVVMPPSGELCLDHTVECDHDVIGLTAYFQFAAFGPGAGQVGISNPASITAVNSGSCDIHAGDFAGWTQGGWGAKCAGNNIACTRDKHFDEVFPNDLILGDQDGIDGDGLFALVLTSAKAVQDFLPDGSTPQGLSGDELNPINSSAGVFAGQLAAAKLNVGFDDAGVFDAFKAQNSKLGDLVYVAGVDSVFFGHSVRSILDLADQAISGAISEPFDVDGDSVGDVTFSQLKDAVEIVNTNFDEGTVNHGNLGYP